MAYYERTGMISHRHPFHGFGANGTTGPAVPAAVPATATVAATAPPTPPSSGLGTFVLLVVVGGAAWWLLRAPSSSGKRRSASGPPSASSPDAVFWPVDSTGKPYMPGPHDSGWRRGETFATKAEADADVRGLVHPHKIRRRPRGGGYTVYFWKG